MEITWRLPDQLLSGSGAASSKKAARREAARRLLQGLPVGAEAEVQMRKQMLQGLRYKLSAEVLEDGPTAESRMAYRVVWRVPQPQGRPPLELSAAAAAASNVEAQWQACEHFLDHLHLTYLLLA